MKVPHKWMNDPFYRSLLHLIGMREPGDLHRGDPLIPYFQYKIGPYQSDHYLYFPEQPGKFSYENEIFSKMYEYRGFDLAKYIEFHYEAYPDKEDFVRFLRFEVARQRQVLRKYRFAFWVRFSKQKAILATVSEWVELEEKRLEAAKMAMPVSVPVSAPVPVPEMPQEVLAAGKDNLLDRIGDEIYGLLQTYMGRIDLYNEHHATKLIRLLRVLQDLRAPGKKGGRLFKTFSDMDMAALLRQFVLFGDKKTNTLQVKIAEVGRDMDPNDPALQKLMNALQEFFFP